MTGTLQNIQHDQRRQHAIAGGAAIQKQHVTGLFSAQNRAMFLHLFQNIFVADGRAQHFDVVASQRGFQAHVRHGGGDHQIFCQAIASV